MRKISYWLALSLREKSVKNSALQKYVNSLLIKTSILQYWLYGINIKILAAD